MKKIINKTKVSIVARSKKGTSWQIIVLYSSIVALFSLITLWPFLKPGFWITDDGDWMIIRLTAFYQSLRDGQVPVRILGRLNQHYGYPVANFLYPGFLYAGSIIKLFGFSFVDSIKVLLGVLVVSGGLAMFWTLKKFHTTHASFFGVLGFFLAPYLVFDLYTRGSVGEIMAISVASWCIWSISYGAKKLFPIIFGLLLLSHNSLSLIFCIYLLTWLIISGKLKTFVVPGLIGIGLAAFFWIPAIFEMQYIRFNVVTVANSLNYLLHGERIFLLGIGSIAGVAVFFDKEMRRSRLTWFHATVICIVSIIALPIAQIIWQKGPLVSLFQFPYRFLALGVISAPWLFAALIDRYRSLLITGAIFIGCLFVSVPFFRNITNVIHEEGFYTTNEGTTTVADEYLPKWVQFKSNGRADTPIRIFSGPATLSIKTFNTRRITAVIKADDTSTVQINSIYYPGWGLLLDGIPHALDYQNYEGVMRFTVDRGVHTITAEFRETVARFAADSLTIASLMFYLFYIWVRKPVSVAKTNNRDL